ncbi:Non-specific serine/threonine protein kinase [Bertholletia excelsa]
MNDDGLVFLREKDEVFKLDQLLGSEAEILNKGMFGCTYMAKLEGKGDLVVKRLKGPCNFERDEIEELGKLVHENLLPLKAYLYSREETLLIYDYLPRGSLSHVLHSGKGGTSESSSLDWQARRNIAYGIARGIEYLHSRGPGVCHGSLSSSNVLLTNSLDACISEFGVAQLFKNKPEATKGEGVDQKTDVFCFGVVLLEVVTGETPVQKGEDLAKWVRRLLREKPILSVFDETLLSRRRKDIEEEMFQILQLGICCTFEYPKNRPSMAAVVNRIKNICCFKS